MRDDKPTYQDRLKGQERLKGILNSERPQPAVPSPTKEPEPESGDARVILFQLRINVTLQARVAHAAVTAQRRLFVDGLALVGEAVAGRTDRLREGAQRGPRV